MELISKRITNYIRYNNYNYARFDDGNEIKWFYDDGSAFSSRRRNSKYDNIIIYTPDEILEKKFQTLLRLEKLKRIIDDDE